MVQVNNDALQNEPGSLSVFNRNGEIFYRIIGVDEMRPFFMSIVSDADHWMFVSSNGGITAGRKNPEYALFPYYTDDKITESPEITGCKTIIRMHINGNLHVWEPFSVRSEAVYSCRRNLYKSQYGNAIIFEEINTALGISFQYEWCSSDRFGFVRKAAIRNHNSESRMVEILDGLQNILPYGVGSDLQSSTSNLADAYKRSELLPGCGLGIFALSAIIVDKAEPSEALKANVVWSAGMEKPEYLLSAQQLKYFRKGNAIYQETDVKGEKGAYFITDSLSLSPEETKEWIIVANVNQSQSAVIALEDSISHHKNIIAEVLADVAKGTERLVALIAAADGLQYTADEAGNARHYSNTLFNIMRGGIFDEGYSISSADYFQYLQKANPHVCALHEKAIQALPAVTNVFALKEMAYATADVDLIRLTTEYLPLKFSRRHGDPSRPWNKFSINTRNEITGKKVLDYEGNWRDIFQNWEALAFSYPSFIEGMIFRFLNASTFDGYNPYRITKDGFDWETIEPDNPWSYIGYWGDHQVIYLLKFLEFAQQRDPQLLASLLQQSLFVYANVPYTIKTYDAILANPKDTISYDHAAEKAIAERRKTMGADGTLHINRSNSIHRVNLTEKLLAMLLAKLTNLVPDGGIWMNTQRPEWNDANNALVGNGLSMVTLYYIRRFLVFMQPIMEANKGMSIALSAELHQYFTTVTAVYANSNTSMGNHEKKQMLDALGMAAGSYRQQIYAQQFSGNTALVTTDAISTFINDALHVIEASIASNKRADGLYHTYNLLSYTDSELEIAHLDEMLEGQVAVLSSGYLSAAESVALLNALRNSALYREDQHSYILYPNKTLPAFLQKNNVPASKVEANPLLMQLLANGGEGVIEKDIHGHYHFNGRLRNANDLSVALDKISQAYKEQVQQYRSNVTELYEQVFNHKAFTGRSGTFFAYEGLGSIYWHMVSKLLLAVQEVCMEAAKQEADPLVRNQLSAHFHAIKEGIGVHKSPVQYGAFPTDPYSHTPFGKGVQQPGMTGQVKEDIISRFGELGVQAINGQLSFVPSLLSANEFSDHPKTITWVNSSGIQQTIQLKEKELLFTICEVPVIYQLNDTSNINIEWKNGVQRNSDTPMLTAAETDNLFKRKGDIAAIRVSLRAAQLFNHE